MFDMHKTCKICFECRIEKTLDEFSKSSQGRLWRQAYCKPCVAAKARAKRAAAPGASAERARAYRAQNPEKSRAANSKYKRKNREKETARVSERTARMRKAVPPWETDVISVETQWRKRHPGMTLDHIVPLTLPVATTLGGKPLHRTNRTFVGPLIPIVYGLHTQANWQPLTALENARKSNRDWPDSPWSVNHV